jgi:hypothetical protein
MSEKYSIGLVIALAVALAMGFAVKALVMSRRTVSGFHGFPCRCGLIGSVLVMSAIKTNSTEVPLLLKIGAGNHRYDPSVLIRNFEAAKTLFARVIDAFISEVLAPCSLGVRHRRA